VDAYSGTYEIRWRDLDANGHVHYSAFIDATGDLRYRFFSERGFPPEWFQRKAIGPVFSSIGAEFLREVLLGEVVTIRYTCTGLSPSGMRWRVHHDILKANGKKAVVLDLAGAILDLNARRAVAPPPELLAAFEQIPRAAGFTVLPERMAIGSLERGG
jgi:acyl-CoA thioester hydrolase